MKTIELLPNSPGIDELVEMAKQESGLTLTKSGHPVAQVIPLPDKPAKRVAPLHPGIWEVSEDFDEPLPDDFWLGME